MWGFLLLGLGCLLGTAADEAPCQKAFYQELPLLQESLAQETDLQEFFGLLVAYVVKHAGDIAEESLSTSPRQLLHCVEAFRLASLFVSIFQEISGLQVSRRHRWLSVAVLKAGLASLAAGKLPPHQDEEGLAELLAARLLQEERAVAAFLELGLPPVPKIPPLVKTTLMDLTRMICLEFRLPPPDDQLHFLQQSELLRYVGAVGSPGTPYLRGLSGQNGFRHVSSCKESRLPFTLGFLDGWAILPLHPGKVLQELRKSMKALTIPDVSAVSMRNKLLDNEHNCRYITAFVHGAPDPLLPVQLTGLYRAQQSLSLGRLFGLFGFDGEAHDEVPAEWCGSSRCYLLHHRLGNLSDGDVYLYRTEDALPPVSGDVEAARTSSKTAAEVEAEMWYAGLGWKAFKGSDRVYSHIAEADAGLFKRKDDVEVYPFSTMPVAVAAQEPATGVVLLPMDFFGRCREQFSWLLVDLVQVLVLILNQGLQNVTVVEPLLHHVMQDALYMHPSQWEDLTSERTEEEAVREVCQLSDKDETFRFGEVFDLGHFQKELRSQGVERTMSFDAFMDEGGAIDTLFLLNAAFQPGGAWVRKIFAEPLLHCQDDNDFNRVVRAFHGREVFVRRVVCLAADDSEASIALNAEKFKQELLEALKHGSRLGFQLYFWSGPERTRFKLHLGQIAWTPSLWRAFKFTPEVEALAEESIRAFLPSRAPFVAVHWRWRDIAAGGLMEYYEKPVIQEQAAASVPLELFNSLTSCAPEYLRCADLFVMTNLPSTSDEFRQLQEIHAADCGPGHVHSLETLRNSALERSRKWGKLHGLLLDMAISSRATFFLGYGGGWAGGYANAGTLVVQQLRLAAGRRYWCAAWLHDRTCALAGARRLSPEVTSCMTDYDTNTAGLWNVESNG